MFLPEFDREYLDEKEYEYKEEIDGNQKGLIIKNWLLPVDKFSADKSDLLILLPPQYPDVPPDMFYFFPDLLLKAANRYPRATEAKHTFKSVNWQRWSRHLDANHWRKGVDGIHTYLKRVDEALRRAS